MAVRLKLRLKRGNKIVDVVALLKSGYETDTPQLLIPTGLARELGLWPPGEASREDIFEAAGGPLRVWIVPEAATVKVLAEDAESKEVAVDLVISPLADEPLISDQLAGRLEIAVEDFAEGLWRFRWEPREKLRGSAERPRTA